MTPITDALQTNCKKCGGVVQYSPDHENLKCLYCRAIAEIDKTAAEIVENDFNYWEKRAIEEAGDDCMAATHEVRCTRCGGEAAMPPNVLNAECAFCRTPLLVSNAAVKRFWKPNYMLPFKVSAKTGRQHFVKWLRKQWLVPSKLLKNAVAHDALKGVYIPFWTYDAMTTTPYRGENAAAVGNATLNRFFDDVVVPASKTLDASIIGQLTFWDLQRCVAFRKEFLAGFITEIYQRDFREAIGDAIKQMQPVIDFAILEEIGGTEPRILFKHPTEYRDVKFKHLLLPVWISAFRYRNKLYQFVVNGRTGQVVGDCPKSVFKIALIILGVIALFAALVALMYDTL